MFFDHLDLFRISDFELRVFLTCHSLGALCVFVRVTPTWVRLRRARFFAVQLNSPESRKYLPAMGGQFDNRLLADRKIRIAGELRYQRYAVNFDFEQRRVA